MRISAKGRYALAAVISMAQQYNSGEYITVISISEKLGISKIYLEQVFSLLKKAKIVNSTKGTQGGYQLARTPSQITVLDVLMSVEVSLFEQAQETVSDKAPDIEQALRLSVFNVLDKNVRQTLSTITIADLVIEAENYKNYNTLMFYI
ncbi:RrF2 family transcriptional regulator [Acetivibrio clariflavus]|uniref:Rrf2 family protein, putative transcriptional regulator n=1 Tax=Acetivibrio clariflavus (strain DSM 19732 / NBRC 101661 / EBR45) TaxID=720554 RepID=G8M1K9_ACECE|nr:Rrf2 family transcriptional regulator [Acetivibrio clariflavus]AEV70238.1 rrf2 family protein, putative transcriptional regulator [Acetivibrio clariflavus DSM 19732]